MANAHETLAQQFYDAFRLELAVTGQGEGFLHYATHLVVQKPPFDLADQDIEDGLTDGALDGGIDAVYTIFNGEAIEEDSDLLAGPIPASVRAGQGRLDVVVVQTKAHGAGTTAIEKLLANLPRLLNLGAPAFTDDEFNASIRERFAIARSAWSRVAGFGCMLNLHVFIATLSDLQPISGETTAKIDQLRQTVNTSLPGVSQVSVELLDAQEIVRRQRLRPPEEFALPYQKCFTSESGHVALIRLSDYVDFVKDEAGRVRTSLLEDNVRDFQGMVEVNAAIRNSLEKAGEPPFWWLNNGVTIICKTATLIGEEFKLRDPKVVNGLQTTRVVHDYLSSRPTDPAGTQLLQVRILSTNAPASRDAVIRATNSQTAVDSASLRATDDVQRGIEMYFQAHGLFYDRRKGSFRGEPVNASAVVSIRDLGQVLTALLLGRPDESRGKPSSLLKDDTRYGSIFNANIGLEVYAFAARMLQRVTLILASDAAPTTAVQRRYLKFHVLAAVIAARLGFWSTGAGRLSALVKSSWTPTDEDVLAAIVSVLSTLDNYINDEGTTIEKATKAQGFTNRLAQHDWKPLAAQKTEARSVD